MLTWVVKQKSYRRVKVEREGGIASQDQPTVDQIS